MSLRSARTSAAATAMVAIFASGPAPAQELWNRTQLGMSPTEVQNVFPQAAKAERSWNRDEMVLRVSALRAGGHDATAFLDFASDGLRTVELILNPAQRGGAINAEEVKTQLSSKYGAPVRCAGNSKECEWRDGVVAITLKANQGPSGDTVAVLYRTYAPAATTAPRIAPTPIDLVRAFYEDLGAGDGDHASQLVVPEKRDRGHYSPEALTSFYSSLPQPIRLLAAYPHDGDSVFVHYRFTAAGGNICDGSADVRTAWVGEQLLIEGIHSYSGC